MPKIIVSKLRQKSRETLFTECEELMKRREKFVYLVPSGNVKKAVTKALLERMYDRRISVFSPPPIYLWKGFINECLKTWGFFKPAILLSEQRLILKTVTQRLMDDNLLPCLREVGVDDRFYDYLEDWLREIKGAGFRPNEPANSLQSTKEAELNKIYHSYEAFLLEHDLFDWGDQQEIFLQQTKNQTVLSGEGLFFQSTALIVDGFNRLSQFQLQIIKGFIKQKRDVFVHLFLDKERSHLFKSTEQLKEQLLQLAEGEEWAWEIITPQREEKLREEITPLSHLHNSLFKHSTQQLIGNHQIKIIQTTHPDHEVREISREIRRAMLANPSLKYSEIGVVFRDLNSYQLLVRESFTEMAIPYQLATESRFVMTPIFKLVLHIYNVFDADWSRDSILTIFNSSYLQVVDQNIVGLFEIILREAGIIKGYERWKQRLNSFPARIEQQLASSGSAGEDKLLVIEKLKATVASLFSELKQLERPQKLTQHCQLLSRFLHKYNLAEQVLANTDPTVLRRDLFSLDLLQQLFQRMISFGEHLEKSAPLRKLSCREFRQELIQRAEELYLPPVSVETEAVQVINPKQCSEKSFSLVFIGGLLEGCFPALKKADRLWRDGARKSLEGESLPPKTEALLEEKIFFLEAVQMATDNLVLSCPTLEVGKSAQPSSFLTEVLNLYSERTVQSIELEGDNNRRELVLTKTELEMSLLKEICAKNDLTTVIPKEVVSNLKRYLSETDNQRWQNLLRRCQMVKLRSSKRFSLYDGQLMAEEILTELKKTYSFEQIYSISQFNEYLRCPFYFFNKRILKLTAVEIPENRLKVQDLGQLYHQILYQFFRQFPGWTKEGFAQVVQRLQIVIQQVWDGFFAISDLPPGLGAIYLEEIMEKLSQILEYELFEAAKQNYQLRPFLLEMSFGLKEELQERGAEAFVAPLVITQPSSKDHAGELRLKFAGKIDRIDQSQDGRYLIIYDYKTGKTPSGFDLQLPIYVKAVEQIFHPEKELLGAGYFSIKDCTRQIGIWRNLRADLIPVSKKSQYYFDQQRWQEIFAETDTLVFEIIHRIRAGDFKVNPTQECSEYCQYKKICRFDPSRIKDTEVISK